MPENCIGDSQPILQQIPEEELNKLRNDNVSIDRSFKHKLCIDWDLDPNYCLGISNQSEQGKKMHRIVMEVGGDKKELIEKLEDLGSRLEKIEKKMEDQVKEAKEKAEEQRLDEFRIVLRNLPPIPSIPLKRSEGYIRMSAYYPGEEIIFIVMGKEAESVIPMIEMVYGDYVSVSKENLTPLIKELKSRVDFLRRDLK